MNELIVLRTNYVDSDVLALLETLHMQSGREIAIAVDDRKGRISTPPAFKRLPVNPGSIGVLDHPDYGWRCGDYALYSALLAFPQFERIWLIEPDVRIHSGDIRSFFDGTGESVHAEFITAHYAEASPEWMWYSTMRPFAGAIFTCMMQLCCVSRRAAMLLWEERKQLTAHFLSKHLPPDSWPNDEAFVAAILKENHFMVATFAKHAPSFEIDRTFTFTKPTSKKWLDTIPYNNRIYHPVVTGRRFKDRIDAYVSDRLKIIGKSAQTDQTIRQDFEEQIRVDETPNIKTTASEESDSSIQPCDTATNNPSGLAQAKPYSNGSSLQRDVIPIRFWNNIRNNGDSISSFIIDRVIGLNPVLVTASRAHVLAVGSILFMANENSVIWGSGALNATSHIPPLASHQILALRGRKTAALLTERGSLGRDVPLGDPGVLVNRLLSPGQRAMAPHFKVGVVPHHNSSKHPFYDDVRKRRDVCVIDILDDTLAVVEQIANCEVIVTQSLHGLVYATSLDKPCAWIADRSDDTWTFKYQDWFTTTDNPQAEPFRMDQGFDDLVSRAELRPFKESVSDLLNAFPKGLAESSPDQIISYAVCRSISPYPVVIDSVDVPIACDSAILHGVIRQFEQQVQSILDITINKWAERPYIIGIARNARAAPKPTQALRMTRALDERSFIGFAFAIEKLGHVSLGVEEVDIGDGVVIYRGLRCAGLVMILRPSFPQSSDEFLVFGF